MDIVLQYASPVMFALLGIFLFFGLIFGAGRGFKRSLIRLITIVIFVGIAFIITPSVVGWVYEMPINIFGNTPKGWIEQATAFLSTTEFMKSFSEIVPDLELFITGVVFAIANILMFFVLYFIAKSISWIFYSMFANSYAPKKNRNTGYMIPQQRFLGMLVGMAQGLVLFFFLFIPVNGLLGLSDKIAEYEAFGGNTVAYINTFAGTGGVTVTTPTSGVYSSDQIVGVVKDVNTSVNSYRNVAGILQINTLSDWAFSYQLNVKLENKNVSLSDDIVSLVHLGLDTQEVIEVMNGINDKIAKGEDALEIVANFTEADYEAIRYYINSVFELGMIEVANSAIQEIDALLGISTTSNQAILVGTENWGGNPIYQDSIYGELITQFAGEAPEDKAKFMEGVRAILGQVRDRGIYFVRDDIINFIDYAEDMFTIQVSDGTPTGKKSIAEVLADSTISLNDRLEIMSGAIGQNDAGYAEEFTPIDVVFANLLEFSFFELLATPGVENIVLHGNYFDVMQKTDPELAALVEKIAVSFMGEGSIGTEQNPGTWLKIADAINSSITVASKYVSIMDDIKVIENELLAGTNPPTDPFMPAVIQYLNNLVDNTVGITEDEKYAEVDEIAYMLNDIISIFPISTELEALINTKLVIEPPFDQVKGLLTGLLVEGQDTVDNWKSIFRSIADMAVVVHENKIITEILGVDFTAPDAIEQLATSVLGDGTVDNPGITSEQAAEVVTSLLELPNAEQIIKDVVAEVTTMAGTESLPVDPEFVDTYLNELFITDPITGESIPDTAKIEAAMDELWAQLGVYGAYVPAP